MKAQEYAAEVERVMPYLLSRGISQEVAQLFMLGYTTSGNYAGRLSIPYTTLGGVVQIKYRCADLTHHDGFKHVHPTCPKYLYEAGTSTHLFNAQVLIHATDTVVLTEGEFDAMCVQAYCGLPAVGYPGVESWQADGHEHWPLCFDSVAEVLVVADGDEVGRVSAKRVSNSLGLSARVVELPDKQDSNSYIASHGASAYLERLQA